MDNQAHTPPRDVIAAPSRGPAPVEQQMSQLTTLVQHLGDEPRANPAAPAASYEQHLAEARLGVASSLFMALRCKHAPAAAHSLRVALSCSAWSFAMKMTESERMQLEIAALLHDVGKIGVPDAVLLKPGMLAADEEQLMNRHRMAGLEILRSCTAPPGMMEIVRHSSAWFDGSRPGQSVAGHDLPLGARMLAIVDAFDSMTTDQVYRKSVSRERALNELYSFAGTQFDPSLVKSFGESHESDHYRRQVAQRWLRELDPQLANSMWHINTLPAPAVELVPADLFQEKLLDSMQDGVAFVDCGMQIVLWNRGAERLTGIPSSGVYQRVWVPSLINLQDEKGHPLSDADCPVTYAIQTGSQSIRRLKVAPRDREPMMVDVHTMPVMGADGTRHGAAVLLHDASPQASLEQRCQNLHEKATKDALTQVANRAEFDRAHKTFVTAHLQRRLPCSLIICDIDHFKQVNDTFGHPAGDEVLKSFSQILRGSCRPGDLVARYGGEEFVVLCANCNNATAAERADQIRRAIADLPQPVLEGRRITVSFGVTEIQPGDTAETMLHRADRALFEAKQRGRNTVVQLGSGIGGEKQEKHRSLNFFWRSTPDVVLDQWLVTTVPLNVAIEKLRGFVADHFARIIEIEGEKITLSFEGQRTPNPLRSHERPFAFTIELRMMEERFQADDAHAKAVGSVLRTRLHVAIRPKRNRDRRRSEIADRARSVMASIKAYLMASDEMAHPEGSARRTMNVYVPWRKQK